MSDYEGLTDLIGFLYLMAFIGVIALLAGLGFGIWWICAHVSLVMR